MQCLLTPHNKYRHTQFRLVGCGRKQACAFVAAEYLNPVAVALGDDYELAVGRQGEVSWVNTRIYVTYLLQKSTALIDTEN